MEQVQTAMEGIVEKYRSEFYPFEMRESGGGWQFLTKKDFHKTVAQLNGEKFLKRLSSAALETLAIIAYKQPITKADIESIRGVSCDYSIQKLLEKELIVISGRNEDMPGKPLIYNTSRTFMDYFGINNAEDLPKLKEVFTEGGIDPTVIGLDTNAETPAEAASEEELTDAPPLVVTPDGELLEESEKDTGNGEQTQTPDDPVEDSDNASDDPIRD
jgi:segregation and condensation protein B